MTGPALLEWAKAWAQNAPWKPEKGAKLSMLRWKYFVQAEDDAFVKLIEAFSKATGVPVEISRESYEDVQPKASVAANTGPGLTCSGASIRCRTCSAKVHGCFGRHRVSRQEVRRWVESAVQYGKSGNKWICVPICYSGNMVNYRLEASKKAGFSKIPDKTDGFLEYAKAMKKNNTPGGFALGHASATATVGCTGACGRTAAILSTKPTR
jgi:multiple sugar transport system substrate-binding protein